MEGQRAPEPVRPLHGLARHGLLHRERVEDEVRGENAAREDEEARVGRHHPEGRRGGALHERHVDDTIDERREPAHQKARENREDQPPARLARRAGRTTDHLLRPKRERVADDRHDDQRKPRPDERRVPLAVHEVVRHRAPHEREPHADRERDGHPRHRNRRRQQDVRRIEDDAPEERPQPARAETRPEVRREPPRALRSHRPHRESRQDGEEEKPDHVVPVEQLVAPASARELLGVPPASPTEHRENAQANGQSIIAAVVHGRLSS